MATFQSISATSASLARVLAACFRDEQPVPNRVTKVLLVRTEDFDSGTRSDDFTFPALSIFLFRVEINKTVRAAWSGAGSLDGRAYLPVDLHYLLTPWADNAEDEHRILGRAMLCLEETPILQGPLLHPRGAWAPNETVQVVAEDISTESLTQAFDALEADFRLSVAYLARIVRIDGRRLPQATVRTAVAGTTPSLEP